MWSAKYSLSSGEKVKESDLEVVRVSLKKQAPQYFSSKALLVGSYFTKAIGQGELIPVSAVTKLAPGTFSKEVPVGIAKSDLPSGSKVGDLVDLYSWILTLLLAVFLFLSRRDSSNTTLSSSTIFFGSSSPRMLR